MRGFLVPVDEGPEELGIFALSFAALAAEELAFTASASRTFAAFALGAFALVFAVLDFTASGFVG